MEKMMEIKIEKMMEIKMGNKIEIKNGKDQDWIVAVESILKEETRQKKSHKGLIHGVPKSLLDRNKPEFYLPQAICFGPYHFRQEDVLHDDMEMLKSEVARKMHDEIISNGDKRGLKSVVEIFMEKSVQERIKKSYAKEIEVSSEEVLAWMIVRDACFVLEVLNRFQEGEDRKEGYDEDGEESVSPYIDSVLSRRRHHPLLTEIAKDMLKMENQLPFWVLEELKSKNSRLSNGGHVNAVWFESALENLSPIKLGERQGRKFQSKHHILQLLHEYIVDNIPATEYTSSTGPKGIATVLDIVGGLLDCLDEYESDISDESATERSKSRCMKLIIHLSRWLLILLVFSPVLVIFLIWGSIFAIWYSIRNYISGKLEHNGEHVPTVEELKRVGVKFKNSEGKKKIGVSGIKFKERSATLYLPKIDIDNRSEVILRNLIALEIFSQDEEKPITRYALLMNDLINTGADVSMLRGKGIITSKLGSDDEIAQLWNSMVTATEMPRYNIIDDACHSINRYRKKWWKVLWAQFIMLHCSKPWLFLSLLAGVTLLLLTFVQVVCLFESCQLKETSTILLR